MGGLVNGQTVKGDLWMIEAGGGNLACYPIGTTSEGPGPRVGHASLLVGNNRWEMLIQDSIHEKPSGGQVPLGRTNHTVVTYNDKLYL